MFIDFLLEVFHEKAESEAVIWRDQSFAYGKLLDWTKQWRSYRRRSYLKMTSRTEEIGSASSTYRLMPYLPFRFRALRAA